MSNVDLLVWISLFGLAVVGVDLVVGEISSRRYDRKVNRRKG